MTQVGDLCQQCGLRASAQIWAPGGVLAWNHGDYQVWCDPCVLNAQLINARERAKEIPQLEQRLATALASEDEASA